MRAKHATTLKEIVGTQTYGAGLFLIRFGFLLYTQLQKT